jgi:hypothetical protein
LDAERSEIKAAETIQPIPALNTVASAHEAFFLPDCDMPLRSNVHLIFQDLLNF